MKKQYAYIQTVENSGKVTSAGSYYFQLVSEDGQIFFFTENDMKKAKTRAKKNAEDLVLSNVKFDVVNDKKEVPKKITFGEALNRLVLPWKW
tara:strand:+ start:1541 stop:1816 length:276 start_codon:yes stop_codon:yes gene_type:complete